MSAYVRFSNRPSGVKHLQAIQHSSVDVAHGLALLFGIGTEALPSWDSKIRWNNLPRDLAVETNGRVKLTCDLTSSSSREDIFPLLVELEFSSYRIRFCVVFMLLLSCCCCFPSPSKIGAVNPYAVHDHGQPACQGHDGLFHPAAPGDLHRPGLEPGPLC